MSIDLLVAGILSEAAVGGGGSITLVGNTGPSSSSTSVVLAHPDGHATNDYAVLSVVNRGNDTTPTLDGWQSLVSYVQSTSSSYRRVTLLGKAVASDAEGDITTDDYGQHFICGLQVWRGVDVGGTPVTVLSSGVSGGTTAVSIPGGTIADGAVIVDTLGLDADVNGTQFSAGFTNSDLTSLTNVFATNIDTLDGYGFYQSHGVANGGGTIGATTATLSTANDWGGVKIALNPA